MRLTLRTLLAYLDDVLEPADAREIGTKISESPVAAAMVDRIREVMRKRRITAPELTGPGSGPDPNLVAEYLDNTLSPEAVTEIERVCLESDIHLAETAGCHQILTIVLGEPVDLPASTRERMYALGAISPPQGQSAEMEARVPIPPATADTRRTAAAAAAAVEAGDETFAQGLPDYLRRRRPLWKRMLPAAVVVVLLAWLAWVFNDFGGTLSRPAPKVAASNVPPVAESDPPPVDEKALPAAEAPEREPPPAEPVPADDADGSIAAVTDSVNPEPPPDLAEPAAKPAAEPPVEPAPPEVVVEPEPVTPAAEVNAPPITYTSIDGIALRYDPETSDWKVLERQSPVAVGDWIAAPEPFTSRLEVALGQLVIVVPGGTAIESVAPAEGRLTSVYLDRGRIVLSRPVGDEASSEPVTVGIQVGQQQLDVALLEPGTLVGIEVLLRQPQGFSETPPDPPFDGGVFVVAGGASVQPQDGEAFVLSPENGWLGWPDADGNWQQGPLLSNPQWVDPIGPPRSQVTAAYARMYEKQFPLDQSVAVGVPAIVRTGPAKISQLAVETLGLTENVPQLLRALQVIHNEGRQAAIVELRKWLPRRPENADVLREQLGTYFREDEVEPLYKLLWGYSADDLRDSETAMQLIEWLSHDDLAVRELALYHIKTLTNRPTDYHPLSPVVERQAAISRLKDVVRRFDGLLPPEE